MAEKARILVIDDDEDIREAMSTVLEEEGYLVDTVMNGKEAIEKSKAKFYNIALVDIRLPDMEGIRLLTAMKETMPNMVKIIVTGYPSQENAVEAVNKGADGYIIKPFKNEDLLNAIKENLKKQQEEKKVNQEKIAEFIKSRVKEKEIANKKSSKSALNQGKFK